ncbi:unnamed protein product, partial [Ascophyllum nodosum]
KPNRGGEDFAAVKLNTTDGSILWKWQNGTSGTDRLMGAALGTGGTVFLGGFTTGLWGDSHAGGIDFAGVLLNLDDGAELYRWQNGTEKDDIALEVAGGYDGLVVLTGTTQGNWSQANHGGNDSFAVMLDSKYMVSESGRAVAPTASETSPPTSYAPSSQSSVPSLPTSAPSIPGLLVSDAPSRQDLESSPPTSAPSTSFLESSSPASGKASPTLLAVVLSLVVIVLLLVCMGLAMVRYRRKVRGAKSSSIVPPNGSNSKHTEKANNGKWKKGATSLLRYAMRGSLANEQRTTSSKALLRRTSETGRMVWRTKSVNSTTVGGIVSEGSLQRSRLTESTPTLMA